ncbi:MAG: tetratricopeptide repeat protein [Candidatus Gastranaerophilaceae bacterium]
MVNNELEKIADKYFKEGNLFEAEKYYKLVLASTPRNTNALYALGYINTGKLDYDLAETFLTAGLKLSGDIKFLELLAYVKEKMFKLYDAIIMYEQVLELKPTEELFTIVSNLYIELELYDNAINISKDYIEKFPNIIAYRRLFLIYLNLFKLKELEVLYQEIKEKFPNKGLAFNLTGMYEEFINHNYDSAIEYYKKAVKTGVSIAGFDLAQCYRRIGNYDEAEKVSKKILKDFPNKNIILNFLAELYFTQRKMRKGFKYYIEREKSDEIKKLKNKWDGSAYPEKTLLVICDSNIILNMRFLYLLNEKFNNIIVATVPDYEQFIQTNGFETVSINDIANTQYDKYVLLSELQYYLNISFENIPSKKGYLKSDYIELSDGLNVGLLWKASGNTMQVVQEQTVDLSKYLSKLFEIEGVNYYSFQKADIFNTINKFPQIKDLSGELNNITDYAKYIKSMDLIIAVDSEVLHLAGAMNVPAIAVLPHNNAWYWFDDKNKTVWYSSVEIIKKGINEDWNAVSEQIVERVMKENGKHKKVK